MYQVSNKMAYANSVDPDQTANIFIPLSSGSTLLVIALSILRNSCIKSPI